MKYLSICLFVLFAIFGLDAFAADVEQLAFLDKAAKFIQDNLLASSATIALIVEFVLRATKTEKPLGIAHLVAAAAEKLSKLFALVANFLDGIFPNRLK